MKTYIDQFLILIFLSALVACGAGGGKDASDNIGGNTIEKTRGNDDFFGDLQVKQPLQRIQVLSNDEGSGLELSCVGNSITGAHLDLSEDKKSIYYSPKNAYVGIDKFDYQIVGEDGETSSAQVVVRINADKNYLGDPPAQTVISIPDYSPPEGLTGPVQGNLPTPYSTTPSHLAANTIYKISKKPELGGVDHWHRITLERGVDYDFSVFFDNSPDAWFDNIWPVIFLYDHDGKEVFRNLQQNINKTVEKYSPNRTEEHYLAVGSDAITVGTAPPFSGENYYLVWFEVRDDYLYTTKTQGRIGGYPINAKLERTNDEDWFKVSLLHAAKYRFLAHELNSLNLNSLELAIRNAEGDVIHQQLVGIEGWFDFDVPGVIGERGDYFVSVRSISGYIGSYQVDVEGGDVPSDVNTYATISFGESLNGSLGSRGDSDWYKASLEAGKQYEVRLTARPSTSGWIKSPRLLLRDWYGAPLFYDAKAFGSNQICLPDCINDAIIKFTAPYSGSFYFDASVEPINRQTPGGIYELSLTETQSLPVDDFKDTIDTHAYIRTRLLQNGNLEIPGDSDWFRLYKFSRETHRVTLRAKDDFEFIKDPVLQLYDQNGTLLSAPVSQNIDGSLTLNLNESVNYGDYFVSVSSSSNAIGSYSLSHQDGEIPDDINTWMPIGTGGEIVSALNRRNDQDYFRLKIEAGAIYQITAEPDNSSVQPAGAIELVILGEEQTILYSRSSGQGATVTIETSGNDSAQTFFIIVRPGATPTPEGAYRIQVRNLSESKICSV